MERLRKRFSGVLNIIRFNWHFYVLAVILIGVLIGLTFYVDQPFQLYFIVLSTAIAVPVLLSLGISFYVYDCSNLYDLPWLKHLAQNYSGKILNIHAGFDETSFILKQKFPSAELTVYDFYDSSKTNEVSIERANRWQSDFPDTIPVNPSKLPAKNNSFSEILITFSAHEIRNEPERIQFLAEMKRILSENGEILVTEHLRDLPNFLAYTIGFFHFYGKRNWKGVFDQSGLILVREVKTTSFVNTFVLKKKN